jgi:C4-type Zn-finger protein
MMSMSEAMKAHCPICGNHDLKRISGEHVDTPTAFVWRLLRVPAFRCEPCRYKYFSILPMQHHRERELPLTPAD